MNGLHEDILTEILKRVPASSLVRLKWTSKRWHALISHPTFVKSQLECSRKDPASRKILKVDLEDSVRRSVRFACADSENLERESPLQVSTSSFPPIRYVIIGGTCDGLVCLVLSADCVSKTCAACKDIICLWNPSTGEFRELPNLHNCCSVPDAYWWPASGFGVGYDCVADDYKVVALANRKFNNVPGKNPLHIWARKTSTWKRVSDSPRNMNFVRTGSFYSKGAVHWMARRSIRNAATSHVILSFGFAKEEFQELPISELIPSSRLDCATIGSLDGRLCVHARPSPDIVETWIMKEYGVETSWAKMFSISAETIPRGLAAGSLQLLTLRKGKILVLGCDLEAPAFLYDLEDKTCSRHRWGYCWFRVYEESLVSPYSCVDGCKLEEVVTSPSCRGSLPRNRSNNNRIS